jgi:hypothetical protein
MSGKMMVYSLVILTHAMMKRPATQQLIDSKLGKSGGGKGG